MPVLAPMSLIGTMLDQVGLFVPRLIAAVVLLVAGLIAAKMLAKVVRTVLSTAGLDRMADNWGVHDATERIGLGRSLTALLSGLVKAILVFVVVLIAVSLLGLPALEQSMNEAILFLPKLVVALVIMMLGLVAGNSVRDRVDRLARQMDLGGSLGLLAMVGVLAITAIIAAAQVGIPTQFLIMLATTVVGGLVLTVALAIGLGTRAVVSQLAAGRYLGESLRPGRTVKVGKVSGEVVEMQGAATLVRTADGTLVRVPNRTLLESLVTLGDLPEGSEEGDTATMTPPPPESTPPPPPPVSPY